jgi:hypothetical protein
MFTFANGQAGVRWVKDPVPIRRGKSSEGIGKVGELGCSSMGLRHWAGALPHGDSSRQGQHGPFGTQISSTRSADVIVHSSASSHRRRCGVFQRPKGPSASGDGLIARANYGQTSGTCQCWTSHTSLARTLVWQLRWSRETMGWDQTSLGRFAVAMRDGDRCSDNRSPLGLAGLLDARGSRRAVAVQDGCREISRSVARRPRSAGHREQAAGEDAQNYTLKEPGSPAGQPSQTLDSHPTAAACTDVPKCHARPSQRFRQAARSLT